MSRDLVPEMHDMLKLTKYKHDFSDFPMDKFKDIIPKTKTWEGVRRHHLKEGFPAFPTTPDTCYLKIADWLASSFSRNKLRKSARGIEEEYIKEDPTDSYAVRKLWHSKELEDRRLESDSQVRALLEFYGSDPRAEEFFNKYDNILRTRPEDAHKGMNVATLLTHCMLTGKFYRILRKNFVLNLSEIGMSFDAVSRMLNDKTDIQWKLCLAKCRFRFHQKPIRARDINIFMQLEEVIKKVKECFSDNIIFSTSEEIVLIYSKEEDLKAVQTIALENGLWVELEVARPTVLGKLTPDPKKEKVETKSAYGELTDLIAPPLCEICQMRKGEEWPEILKREGKLESMGILPEEVPTEHLCQTCASIRLKRAPLGKLRGWIDQGEGFKLAWTKIKLDYDRLREVLSTLYCDYLKGLGLSPAEAQIRFSIVSEFQEDYDAFLSAFRNRIIEEFEIENIERILGDFYCVKIENTKDVLRLLKIYKGLLSNHFSKLLKLGIDSPISLSVVLARSKFPFFQCWREIEDSKPDIHVALVGHGKMTLRNNMLDSLLLASDTKYRKSALHKLAEVSRLSEALAKLRFEDRAKDEDSKTYRQLREKLLPLGMGFRDILTFARILED